MNQSNDGSLTSADLFAGAGGLAVGFHEAGFEPVFFNEVEPVFAATFQTNFKDAMPFVCPIQELSAAEIWQKVRGDAKHLDVMVGGPPCQGFSINAPVRSTTDARNHLFRHYVRLVLEGLRPKFVVLENVPGVISFDNGETLKNMKRAFECAGYRVVYGILNAAHYGVPEERWRLILIGTRLQEIELSLPMPTHYSTRRANFAGGRELTFSYAIGKPAQKDLYNLPLADPVTVSQAISDLPKIDTGEGAEEAAYRIAPRSEYQAMMRKGSQVLFNHQCAGLSDINLNRIRHVKPGGSWRDIPVDLLPKGLKRAKRSDHTRRYGRLHPDELSGTIMTKCDPHWGTVIHYEQDRIISVREAARIQSFPDWFRFTGSKVDQYRQVGNAVPPLLGRAIAQHILNLLQQRKSVKPRNNLNLAVGRNVGKP